MLRLLRYLLLTFCVHIVIFGLDMRGKPLMTFAIVTDFELKDQVFHEERVFLNLSLFFSFFYNLFRFLYTLFFLNFAKKIFFCEDSLKN